MTGVWSQILGSDPENDPIFTLTHLCCAPPYTSAAQDPWPLYHGRESPLQPLAQP